MFSDRIIGASVIVCLFWAFAASSSALASSNLSARIDAKLDSVEDELIAVRRDFHRHPELSGEEERTAKVVTERLRKLGLEVRTGVGGHGVVAVLEGGKPGPVVGYRADMDAVRSDAPDPVEFASVKPGIRHICGHDVHTTVALAIAEGLAVVQEDLPGTVKFFFQPAEETATGARAMIADGALEDPRPEAIFAVHTAPLPVGSLGTQSGPLLPGRDLASVTLSGDGDLKAAAAAVAEIVQAVNTLTFEQAMTPQTGDFLTGQVFESAAGPEDGQWQVKALITTASAVMRKKARADIDRALRELGIEGVKAELEYHERVMAGVTNDPELEGRMREAIRSVVGDEGLVVSEGVPALFSEDYGSFQDEFPGVMYWLGVSNPEKGTVGMPHSPQYVADEEAIQVGARAMTTVLLEFLGAR